MHQVLALDQGGRPCRWESLEKALYYLVKGLVSWSFGEEVPLRGGFSGKTGERTIVAVPSIIALSHQAYDAKTVALNNAALFRRDRMRCCYCGGQFSRGELSREHILPVSRGGADVWTNCATACKACNNKKGDRLLEECGMQLLYVPYAPSPVESLILDGRNIKADQMEFLVRCLPAESQLRPAA